ncbi:MAG: stage V sporulation protein AB [Lachnospiraceae bacterium]
MNVMKYAMLIICGLCAGFTTAAAYIAFISILGIFPKTAEKTKTASQCILYENCLFLGILFSTFIQFFLTYESAGYEAGYLPPAGISIIILIFIGLFGGIYTGFLIGGLSEILNVFPIFASKTHIAEKIKYAIVSLALGKGFFLIIETFFNR